MALMVAPIHVFAHGCDLPFDERIEGFEQRLERRRCFKGFQGLGDGFLISQFCKPSTASRAVFSAWPTSLGCCRISTRVRLGTWGIREHRH